MPYPGRTSKPSPSCRLTSEPQRSEIPEQEVVLCPPRHEAASPLHKGGREGHCVALHLAHVGRILRRAHLHGTNKNKQVNKHTWY